MTKWKEYKLIDIADFIDYRGKTPNKTTFGVPLITAKIVKNGTIQEPTEYISKEDYPKWMTRGFPKVGDIVLTTEAPLGEVAQIKDASFALAQRIITIRGKEGIIDNGYLKYFLQSAKGQHRLKERETGTTVTGIKSAELKQVLISAPDFKTQTAISEILTSLDDKIELNNKINQELENLAQTLFKQWFIDFEFPFDFAQGKPKENKSILSGDGVTLSAVEGYKSSGGEMVESELGEIPKGWVVKTLSEIVTLTGGGTPKRSNSKYWDGGEIPWFSVQDVPKLSEVVVIDTKEKITLAGLKNSSTKILPVGTTIITARGTVGKLAFVAVPMAMNQSCYGVNGKDGIGVFFNYLNLSKAVQELKQNTHGAVFDTITSSTFQTIKTILPHSLKLREFETLIESLFWTIENNVRENQSLTNLRDTLLPKLISGELEVAEVMAENL